MNGARGESQNRFCAGARGEIKNKCTRGGGKAEINVQGEGRGKGKEAQQRPPTYTPTNQPARFTHQRVTPRVSNKDESHEAGKFATPIRSLPPGMDGALY